MASLKVLETDLKSQTFARKFSPDSAIATFATKHFKSTSYTLGRYTSDACKILGGITAVASGLAYFSIGQKHERIGTLYAKYTPRKIAYVLLAASACLVAFTVIWDLMERKNTHNLCDAFESDDAATIIKAYKKSGMPPAQLLRIAAEKNSTTGMALALHTIRGEEARKKHAQAAHGFGTSRTQEYLTQSFKLEHPCFTRHVPGKIEKVDGELYKALTCGPRIEFDPSIRGLAARHFETANASSKKRKYMRLGSYAITALTGALAPLAYLGYGQKLGPIRSLYTKYTTRNIAIALAIVFIASALLSRYLLMRENKLENKLLAACRPDKKAAAKLAMNIRNCSTLPTQIEDAVKAYGEGMTPEDRRLLKTALEQNKDLLKPLPLTEDSLINSSVGDWRQFTELLIQKLKQNGTDRDIEFIAAAIEKNPTILDDDFPNERYAARYLVALHQNKAHYNLTTKEKIKVLHGLQRLEVSLNGAHPPFSKVYEEVLALSGIKTKLSLNPGILADSMHSLQALAALKAYGLPPSRSAQADLLAQVASTGNIAATNAIIAALDAKNRPEIVRLAYLQQTGHLELLEAIVKESDETLFERAVTAYIRDIQSGKEPSVTLRRLIYVGQKTQKAKKLAEWKKAHERPERALPMDRIVTALDRIGRLKPADKLRLLPACGQGLRLAAEIYEMNRTCAVGQMSKASARIVASWT